MTRDELIEKLKGYEWRDIEFKEAQHEVPKNAYTTVSAFANTDGGHLIFGVRQTPDSFEIIGVKHVDAVHSSFLNTLRSCQKIRTFIPVQESRVDDEKGTVLIFFVPEAPRRQKPIHLEGNLRESYIRRGGSDQHCTEEEIRRFIRDAADVPYDSESVPDLSAETFFDEEVLRWYRAEMNRRHPGRHEALTDFEFLNEWGFVVEKQGGTVPTRAGILVFGQAKYVRQILPRPVVDYQRIDFNAADWTPDQRWSDRVVIEENLIRAWWQLVERFMKLAERPFSLDIATLRREDEPPDYISFREAAINLLIHQDYGDGRRLAVVQIFRDQTMFFNPGDNFYSEDRLLDPGAKDVRNPGIVSAFRRIGLSDQAGTGFRAIFKNWRRLGNVPPDMLNDKAQKTFTLALRRTPLISEKQRILQATLGVHLSEPEADAFAYACQKQRLTVTDVRAITGATTGEARGILDRLTVQVLLKLVDADAGIYELQDQFKGKVPVVAPELEAAMAADQSIVPATPLTALDEKQWAILAMCDVPRSMKELLDGVGLASRDFFVTKHLQPILEAGLVVMTQPDSPRSPTQRYILTPKGLELHVWHMKEA